MKTDIPTVINALKKHHCNLSDSSLQQIRQHVQNSLNITLHSQHTDHQSLFFLLPTNITDNKKIYQPNKCLQYINQAIENNTSLIFIDEELANLYLHDIIKKWEKSEDIFYFKNTMIITVDDVVSFLNKLICSCGGYKSIINNITNILGVTGTNGKTSVVDFIRQLQATIYGKSASLGTLGCLLQNKNSLPVTINSNNHQTTNDILNNLTFLQKQNIQNDIKHYAVEISSHALIQKRIHSLPFSNISFTNFDSDHLDYHCSYDSYLQAKLQITKLTNTIILNSDIEKITEINEAFTKHSRKQTQKNKPPLLLIAYGHKKLVTANYGIKIEDYTFLNNNTTQVKLNCYGRWNQTFVCETPFLTNIEIQNSICALLQILFAKNLTPSSKDFIILSKYLMDLKQVPGRLQLVATTNKNAQIFIDYAHNANGIETVLKEFQILRNKIKSEQQNNMTTQSKSRLVILFGAGGDRDQKKRFHMGYNAAKFSDQIIVTDDNPRFENPSTIRKSIIDGVQKYYNNSKNCLTIQKYNSSNMNDKHKIKHAPIIEVTHSRKHAICIAIDNLQENDILIIAGKGHENYQIINDLSIPHNDSDIILQHLQTTNKAALNK